MISSRSRPEPYEVSIVSFDGAPTIDGYSRSLSVDASIESCGSCAAVIVPAYLCDGEHTFPATPALGAIAAWLRSQHAMGAIVLASCNGVFLLGEAGLLDGRRCTTTWWRYNALKTRYPRADIAWGAPLLEDARVITAGGPLSWIDLSLTAIRRLVGPEAAKTAADFTIVGAISSSQLNYVPKGHVAAVNSIVVDAENILRETTNLAMSAKMLAKALGVSERTLHRRLKAASGETPKELIERVRIETARMLLETTKHSVKQLARSSGYGDETSFRRAFQRNAGMTPGAYRNRRRIAAAGDAR
jgi:transcriptional regulator GlxA family with amidase domain